MNLGLGLLESVIFGAKTLSFINTVGVEVIGKTISVTTNSIGGLVTHFMKMDQPGIMEFKKTLENVDMEFKIGVLEELVKEQKGTTPVSVKKALMGVNDVLVRIDAELKTIKQAFEYHQTKYFKGWRKFDCSCNIETIKRHSQLLDNRSRVLTDLLKIYNESINQNVNTTIEDKEISIEDLS